MAGLQACHVSPDSFLVTLAERFSNSAAGTLSSRLVLTPSRCTSVTQRRPGIGIRMTIGAAAHPRQDARVAQVTGSFVRRATVPLGVGLATGLTGSVVLGRLLRTWLRFLVTLA